MRSKANRLKLDWWPRCVNCDEPIDPKWFHEDLTVSHNGLHQVEVDCPYCTSSLILTMRINLELT